MSASVCPRCILGSHAALGERGAATDKFGPALNAPVSGAMEFGDYVLEEEIAHGGMGVIYRARQVELNRTVAIKLLLLGRYSSAESVERFRREARAAAALRHPNIVAIYEVGEHDGQHFLAMEFVEGRNLLAVLREGPLTSRHAAEIVVSVARAIQYAHEHGVLHRDLKSSNVIIDALGQVHVTDFGLAKKLDGSSDLTVTGQMIGTPNYLSPEQAAGRQSEVGPPSDVYSIGALLYELLTARPPFMADSLQDTLLRIRDAEPVSPRMLNPAVDRELETIGLKCLEKNPQRRYHSAEALAEELERWLRGEPILTRPCSPWMRLMKWTRRQPRIAMLTLVSVLAVVTLVLGLTIMSVHLKRANTDVRATNTRLSASLYELQWRKADEASRADEGDETIAWLSHALRRNPSDSVAAARLLSLLSSYSFPVPLLPPLLHEDRLVAVDFGQSGERLATATAAGTARLWNIQSGKVEIELPHPAQLTHCVLGGAGDRRLLTISTEPKARLWDLSSQQVVKEFSRSPMRLLGNRVLLTCDRRLMALKVQSNVVAVLNADSGEWAVPPLSLPAEIVDFALSEDGRQLATGTRSEVQLWDVNSNRALHAPVQMTAAPTALRFSEDGRWLGCSVNGKAWVMNTLTGAREREFNIGGSTIALVDNTEHVITRLPFTVFNFRTGQDRGSAIGQSRFDWLRHASLTALLFSSKSADRVQMLDPSTGRSRVEPFFHDGWIVASKLHPNGKTVATASQDRTARIWSVEMGKAEPLTLPVGGAIYEAQWSPSGDKILSASIREGATKFQLWHGQTGAPLIPPRDSGDLIYFASWSADSSRFATASQDHTTRIWDGKTGEPMSPPLRHEGVVVSCAFSPDGQLLASGAADKMVRLWEGHTGKAIGAPLPHSHTPLKIVFSKDGRRLASASEDGTIRVWSMPDGQLVVGPLRHDGTCWGVAFSPDDRWLASSSSDGTARLWDAATGKPALLPLRHEGPVLGASFSPNGRAIATSTESGMARVWDTATGQPLSEPMRHPDRVWLVRWSPDGRFLATSCVDGTARIWDVATGHLAAEPFTHEKGKEVRRVAFSPDGRRLLTASYDGRIKIWDLTLVRPPVPVPDWLPDLAEALGGKRIGPKEAPETVPGDSFHKVQARITQTREQDHYYSRWAKWMLEERFQRPVKPFQP